MPAQSTGTRRGELSTLQAMPVVMPGKLLADTMAVMASLDPVMGGVDK